MAPYLGLSLVSSIPILLVDDPRSVAGFYVFSALNALIYLLLSILIIDMHQRENGHGKSLVMGLFKERYPIKGAAFGVAIAALLAGSALRAQSGAQALVIKTPSDFGFLADTVSKKPELGLGVYDPTRQFATSNGLAVEHTFVSWTDPTLATRLSDAANYARSRGRWLMVTVEPWPTDGRRSSPLLKDISQNAYDRTIDQFCGTVARLPTGIFVRWGHEMDLPSGRYPWATKQPHDYVLAYQHFVQRCKVKTQMGT